VDDDAAGGNLFDRTQAFVLQNGGDEKAVQNTYAAVAMTAQATQLINTLNVDSLADFDETEFDRSYRGFSESYTNYARVVEANPQQDSATTLEQVQIASAAGNVASQTNAFAAANIRSELGAAILRLFESLTLQGYAKRHPGLEHHAGVPNGGTLVLAYVSLDALAAQFSPIMTHLGPPVASLNNALQPNAAAAAPAGIESLAAAVADRTDDPLDRFIVLADFCLPYQCCDADCSDVALSERIIADPFGPDVDPGPMAVPPLDPTPLPQISPLPDGGPVLTGRDVLPGRPRPVAIEPNFTSGIISPFERFTRVAPVVDTRPTRPTDPVDSGTQGVTVFGIVGVRGRTGIVPVEESFVVFTGEDGQESRQRTDRGEFKIVVPPGQLRIRGTAARHRGTSQDLVLRPGEERELTLLVEPTG
jgi:hypothetical protein